MTTEVQQRAHLVGDTILAKDPTNIDYAGAGCAVLGPIFVRDPADTAYSRIGCGVGPVFARDPTNIGCVGVGCGVLNSVVKGAIRAIEDVARNTTKTLKGYFYPKTRCYRCVKGGIAAIIVGWIIKPAPASGLLVIVGIALLIYGMRGIQK